MSKKPKYKPSELRDMDYSALLQIATDPEMKPLVLDVLAERAASSARRKAEYDLKAIATISTWTTELILKELDGGDLHYFARAEWVRRARAARPREPLP